MKVRITRGRHAGITGTLVGPILREDGRYAVELESGGERLYADLDAVAFPEFRRLAFADLHV